MIKINTHIKKVLCLCLSLILCTLLFACGRDDDRGSKTTSIPTVTITFPEGYTILQISEKLEKNGVCSAADFTELCKTVPDGYNALLGDVDAANRIFALEGYIFPDTYEFYVNEGAEMLLQDFSLTREAKLRLVILTERRSSACP